MRLSWYFVVLMFVVITIPSTCFAGFFDDVFGKPLKDGIVVDKKLQVDNVKAIASKYNDDIYSFIKNIYESKIDSNGKTHYIKLGENVTNNPEKDYWYTEIFNIYCKSKKGDLYKYSENKEKIYYGCEIGGNLDSIQQLSYYIEGQRGYYQYIYRNNDGFKDSLKDNIYLSSNIDETGAILIKQAGRIFGGSSFYDITFNIKNSSSSL